MGKQQKSRQVRTRLSRSTSISRKENVVFEYLKRDGEVVEVQSFLSGNLLQKVKVFALSQKDFEEINAPVTNGE